MKSHLNVQLNFESTNSMEYKKRTRLTITFQALEIIVFYNPEVDNPLDDASHTDVC